MWANSDKDSQARLNHGDQEVPAVTSLHPIASPHSTVDSSLSELLSKDLVLSLVAPWWGSHMAPASFPYIQGILTIA